MFKWLCHLLDGVKTFPTELDVKNRQEVHDMIYGIGGVNTPAKSRGTVVVSLGM